MTTLQQDVEKSEVNVGGNGYCAPGRVTGEFDHLPKLRLKNPPLRQHAEWYESWKRRIKAERKKRTTVKEPISDEELHKQAKYVLESEDPLKVYREEYRRLGYGGDLDPIMLVTLSMTTRLLKMRRGAMPSHTGVIGPPSIGKSYTVQTAISVFPEEAYHVIDAGSPRVLIYDPAELKHRVLLFSESDSLPAGEDNPAASAVRNLCQDHYLHYAVTVKDPETGEFTIKEIVKEGPTTLLTTAVRFLGGQLGTRLFLVEVPEDIKRLQEALAAQAKLEVNIPGEPNQGLIAYQAILQRKAPIDVIVPFAPALSEEIGKLANASRILRDYQRLISLIKAVAILRFPNREVGDDGRLIATVDDYEAVFNLVEEAYRTAISETSRGVRELVEAVAKMEADANVEPITFNAVAKQLNVHREQVKRRATRAIRQSWLINKEERKSYPAKLTAKGADPLPETAGLPMPSFLRGRCDSVTRGGCGSQDDHSNNGSVTVSHPARKEEGTALSTLPASLDAFTASIDIVDAEFYAPAGHNPKHHAVSVNELRHAETDCQLCDEFVEGRPLYGTGARSLMVAYCGTQDLTGFLEAGFELPENFIDLGVEAKLDSNIPRFRKVPSLYESLDKFGIPHSMTAAEKKKEAKRYNKPVLTETDRRDVRVYCPSDTRYTAELFLNLLPNIDIPRALRFGDYVKECARIAYRGIPVDAPLFEKMRCNRQQIRLDIIHQSPIGSAIYTDKGVRCTEKIQTWIKANFENWEETPKSGKPCLQDAYLKKLVAMLGDDSPQAAATIQQLIDLMADLKDFDEPPFGVAPDGRTHADQRPFTAESGRNAPKKFILNAKKWWRFIIKPVKGTAIANLDFSAEEPAISAYCSGDLAMIAAYEAGDVHQAIADALGVTRKSAKTCVLGMLYGRGSRSLAEKEGIPYGEAERILDYHRATYQRYWSWSDSIVETVRSTGRYELPDGWAIKVDGPFKDNSEEARTIKNFAVQGMGAVILREVVRVAAKEHINIIGTHHDSILIEAPLSEIDDYVKRLDQIMRDVSRQFIGHEIKVDRPNICDDRFKESDKDAVKDWQRISEILEKYN